jgi:hypothetical protein
MPVAVPATGPPRSTSEGNDTMVARQFPCVATALAILGSSQAFAADVVTLRCDFAGFYTNIVADQRGISITQYQENKETKKLEYIKAYYENKKEATSEYYYRINSVEIAWGSKYNLLGTIVQLDSTLNLRTGIERDDMMFIGKEVKQRPTQVGHCKPN